LLLVLINLVFGGFIRAAGTSCCHVGLAGVIMLIGSGHSRIARGSRGHHGGLHGLGARQRAESAWLQSGAGSHRLCKRVALREDWLCWPYRLSPASHGIAGASRCVAAWLYLVVFGSLIAFNAYMLAARPYDVESCIELYLGEPCVALFLGVTWGGESVSTWSGSSSGVGHIGVVLLFAGRRRPAPDSVSNGSSQSIAGACQSQSS